jgi:hypothetical protein
MWLLVAQECSPQAMRKDLGYIPSGEVWTSSILNLRGRSSLRMLTEASPTA